MNVSEVRTKYLNFFSQSPRNHAVIPSSSLVPENDPTTLFTGSGMQPLIPYLMGEKHPKGTRLTNSQKCFRAEDIDEVGDNRHTTFFEMLGNWSFGDYFKEEQLAWFFEFLTEEIKIPRDRLWVTCFKGDKKLNLSPDNESSKIWKGLGIPEERILFYSSDKNWWSRAGKPEDMPAGEIGGPDSEVFYDFQTAHDPSFGEHCHPNCECGRFMEIGNSVFMEYIKKPDGVFEKLPQQNVDFGGGLERITAASNNNADIFLVNVLSGIIQQLEIWSYKKYGGGDEDLKKSFRIAVDHIRSATFMIDDGVSPANTEQGYILRRLIRRAVFHIDKLGFKKEDLYKVVIVIADRYRSVYHTIQEKQTEIAEVILKEEEAFRKTLERGMREFEKQDVTIRVGDPNKSIQGINGQRAFELYTTFGFPIELTQEIAKGRGMEVDIEEFNILMRKHQKISRAGAEQKFKGGLADSSEKVVAYHTATHLLLAGLRKELGENVHQAGSNITNERLRFDFTYPEKVQRGTLEKVENFVNTAIKAGARVNTETMDKSKAHADPTVEGSFWDKYPDRVTVYTIGDDNGVIYSRELCGGPHVENTSKIEGTFRITKEEAVAAGVRRVRAVLL